MSDSVCCLCGDKLNNHPDLEEHISARHWDIFDDGQPPSDIGQDQAASSSSTADPDSAANGLNPGEEEVKHESSQQLDIAPKPPIPNLEPSKGLTALNKPEGGQSQVS